MATKRLITILGGTGKQGGSIIDVVLARPELSAKYALRSITRDTSSGKAQALTSKGVEMVKAELDDLESLKSAFRGSYGVFGVTDFWSIMDKAREIQQGKNIVDAAKAEGVQHLVFSGLPWVEKLTNGELKHVEHFDGKAEIVEYAESAKGDMVASYFMPAMFIDFTKNQVKEVDGKPTLSMPFPSENIAWPLIDIRRDGGKFVMGIFEAGATANGARVHAVSTWTTPKEVVAALSKVAGQEVVFRTISGEEYGKHLSEPVRDELVETMLLIGNYSYFGKGEEKKQSEHDKWLIKDADLIPYARWAEASGPLKL